MEISKGTFYYYFESKEDILKVLALRETEKKLALTGKIVEDEKLTAIDKINKLISEAQKINFIEAENRARIYKMVDEYSNLKFQQRLYENSIQSGVPLIQRIFQQGIDEKIMKMEDPEEAAALYIEMMNRYKAAMGKMWFEIQDKDQLKLLIKKKTKFYQDVFEKILGVEKGQLLFLAITFQYVEQL